MLTYVKPLFSNNKIPKFTNTRNIILRTGGRRWKTSSHDRSWLCLKAKFKSLGLFKFQSFACPTAVTFASLRCLEHPKSSPHVTEHCKRLNQIKAFGSAGNLLWHEKIKSSSHVFVSYCIFIYFAAPMPYHFHFEQRSARHHKPL